MKFLYVSGSGVQSHMCIQSSYQDHRTTPYFHWKARLQPPPFKLCKPVFWRLDAKRPHDQKPNVLVVESPCPTVDKRTMAVVG